MVFPFIFFFPCFWTILNRQPWGVLFPLICGRCVEWQGKASHLPLEGPLDWEFVLLYSEFCVCCYTMRVGEKKSILAGMSAPSHIFPLHSSLMVTPDWIISSILFRKEGSLRQGFQSSFCWQLFKWSFLGSCVSNTIILFVFLTMNYDKLSWYARL